MMLRVSLGLLLLVSCQGLGELTAAADICGTLVQAGFLSQAEADGMTADDCRNTLISELGKLPGTTSVADLQAKSNADLIELGAASLAEKAKRDGHYPTTTTTTAGPGQLSNTSTAVWEHLAVGTKIDSMYRKTTQWYPATVSNVDKAGRTYDVKYDDGEVGTARKPAQVCARKACDNTPSFAAGAVIEAKWGSTFYGGKIAKVRNTCGKCTYDVTFNDGDNKYAMVPANIKADDTEAKVLAAEKAAKAQEARDKAEDAKMAEAEKREAQLELEKAEETGGGGHGGRHG